MTERSPASRGKRRASSTRARLRMPAWADDLPITALVLLVVAAPLGMSSVFPVAQSWCVLGAGMSAMALCATDRAGGHVPSVVAVGLVLVGWTAFQWLPLPCAFVRVVSPLAVLHAEQAAELVRGTVTCRISRAPAATFEELTKVLAIVACACAAVSATRNGKRLLLLRTVAAASIALAVVGLLHWGTGASRVYGLVDLRFAHPPVVSPLVNDNHLSIMLAIGVALCTEFHLHAGARGERWGWLVGALVCGGVALLTRSRAGTVAAALAPLLVAAVHGQRRRAVHAKIPSRALVVAGALTILGLVASADLLAAKWAAHDYSKLRLAWAGLRVAFDAPFVGVGRGAFSSAFVGHAGASERYVHPENLPVQWLTEWGVPVASFALASLIAAFWRAWNDEISTPQRSALVALILLGTHDFVDFSLESMGVALPAAVLAVVATLPARHAESRVRSRWAVRLRHVGAAVGLCAVLTSAWALSAGALRVNALEQGLGARIQRGDDVSRELESAVVGFPEEPVVALLGATWAVRRGEASAGRWLTRAMTLAPEWSGPHVLAGAWLAKLGRPDQAALEFREAARRQTNSPVAYLCAWLGRGAARELGLQSAPPMPARTVFLDALATCSRARPDDAAFFDAEILAHTPDHVLALRRSAARARSAGDFGRAISSLEHLVTLTTDVGVRLDWVDVLLDAGQADRAESALRPLLQDNAESIEVVRRQARIAATRHDDAAMGAALMHLRALSADSTEHLHEALVFAGRLEASRGRLGPALRTFSEAYRTSGDISALRELASTAERAGDRTRALNAYAELCAHSDPPGCAARDRLERALARERAGMRGQPTKAPLDPPAR